MRNEIEINVILNTLFEEFEPPTKKEVAVVADLLITYMNHTTRWTLKGKKPSDLSGTPPAPSNVVNFTKRKEQQPMKAGRNDPCACGNGKKYKKCCGK
ncbi:SEC-C metal-binding domain-containing protein [Jeotgalibacillus terrae]|uniref:SEC-C metal-binding domain-containing protein n=1 Tax=Jeotgalibacillus terrae TaxID=587735 RepID=A0ABW5ZFG2_9BACL|nr:SEC-C metal-binding domain-containing protein [Jeotgalibacillus terrae]MBM7579100.1 uncharacterized protein YecA (UPF0149 family) [Jeotgalibacillus terrae]